MPSPMRTRMAGTDKSMLASGRWAKVGRKAYRHDSGSEIRHDGGGWVIDGNPKTRYVALWVARYEVKKAYP